MDTYIEYFRSWLYAIALNNTDNKQYDEFVLDLISRIDSGGLERYIVQRVQEDLGVKGKSEAQENPAVKNRRETEYEQLDERLKKVEKVTELLIQHCPEIDFVELIRKEKRNRG